MQARHRAAICERCGGHECPGVRLPARFGERVDALDHEPRWPATAEVELAVEAADRPQDEASAVSDASHHRFAQPPAIHAIWSDVEVAVMQVERSIDEPFAISALRGPSLEGAIQRLRVLRPAAVVDLIAKDERSRRQALGKKVERRCRAERDAPWPLRGLDRLGDSIRIERLALDHHHVAARPKPDAAQQVIPAVEPDRFANAGAKVIAQVDAVQTNGLREAERIRAVCVDQWPRLERSKGSH